MEELNTAIMSIDQADPSFSARLMEKYFSSASQTLLLSAAEQAYIADSGVLRVGVLTGQPPYQYTSKQGGELRGISVELLDFISQKTGLRFELVPADTQEQLYDMANDGTVALVAGMPYHLKLIPQTHEPRRMCFGVSKDSDRTLLSILNKAVTSISESYMQGIINQNILESTPLTLGYLVRENPVESICILAGIALVIIAILAYFLWQRAQLSHKNALELERHYRVYALVSEFFFEYRFRENTALVSIPAADDQTAPRLLELNFSETPEDADAAASQRAFLELVRSRQDGLHEVRLHCGENGYHWLRIALETVCDGDVPVFALGRINIIDAERQERDELPARAELDSLTHIYNAETCRTRAEASLAGLPEGRQGALLLLDIDHFKQINDTCGHLCGDEALGRLARLLRDSFRADDIVGRPGGDEFLVYLPRVKDRSALAAKCAALCAEVHRLEVNGRPLSVSVGAAIAAPGTAYDALYRRADEALYRAKELGRDRYWLAEEGQDAP